MEKTEKISIGHYLFSLDDEAYTILNGYMDRLSEHYGSQNEGPEIMDSIEARIAELLYEKCGRDGVVSAADINSIIGIMGYPDAETEGDGAQKNEDTSKCDSDRGSRNDSSRRRLYRDMTDSKIAGVCGGLAKSFSMDPIWLRLGFVILLVAGLIIKDQMHVFSRTGMLMMKACWISPLLYIILWICLPTASSARQRWEMRGEDGSVNDISANRKEHSTRQEYKNSSNEENKKNKRGCLAVGFGIVLLLCGTYGLFTKSIVLGGLLFATNATFGLFSWIPGADLIEMMLGAFPFTSFLVNPWLQIILSLIIILPSILVIYGGIILTFDINTPRWKPGLWLILLWLLLFVGMIPVSLLSFRSSRTISNIEKVLDSNIDFHVSGNVVKDFEQLQKWMEEHNFDTDGWEELNEWLEYHNFDEDNLPEMQEWLEEHNFAEPDTLFCPEDSTSQSL